MGLKAAPKHPCLDTPIDKEVIKYATERKVLLVHSTMEYDSSTKRFRVSAGEGLNPDLLKGLIKQKTVPIMASHGKSLPEDAAKPD